MSRTKQPCPGCGLVDPGRPASGVCYECNVKLKLADRVIKQEKTRKDVPVWIPEAVHEGPRFYHADMNGGIRDALDVAMHNVVFSIGNVSSIRRIGYEDTKEPGKTFWELRDKAKVPVHDGWSIYRAQGDTRTPPKQHFGYISFMTADQLENIRNLYTAIAAALMDVYAEGVEKGRNALCQLAAGEITTDKFNELATRAVRPWEVAQR